MNAEVTREIQWLADSFSDLDTKLLAFLGFIGLAVPYILMHRRGGVYWLIPITVFGVIAISGFRALRPRKLSSAPEPYAIIDAYETAVAKGALNTKEILLGEVLGTKAAAYRQDLEAIRNKASWYRRTEILLAVALYYRSSQSMEVVAMPEQVELSVQVSLPQSVPPQVAASQEPLLAPVLASRK